MLFKATLRISLVLTTVFALVGITTLSSRIWFHTIYDQPTVRLRFARLEMNASDETHADFVLTQDDTTQDTHLPSPPTRFIFSSNTKQLSSDINRSSSSGSRNPIRNELDHVRVTNMSQDATLGPPASQTKNCHKKHCMEYLSRYDLAAMKSCFRETAQKTVHGRLNLIKSVIKENDCNFMDGKYRRPVALVSTEGSGNTWVRGLLEMTTGICTGFLYCDFMMRKQGFIGEGIKSGSVLVVKTHTLIPQWHGIKYKHPKHDEPYYGSAIFIVRNPFNALIAEWNRRATNEIIIKKHLPHNESHTNVVPKEYWGMCVLYCCHQMCEAFSSTYRN